MSKYKVGDKVRIVKSDSGYSEDFTGQECFVVGVAKHGLDLQITYECGAFRTLYFANYEVEPVGSKITEAATATDILQDATECLTARAVERDKGTSERSMKAAVVAFNALTGHTLTEEQGYVFMTVLKISRSQGGCFKLDDFVDMAAYAALAGEAGGKQC